MSITNGGNTDQYGSMAAWRSATGWDVHTVTTDPLLDNGYGIPLNSPAYQTGVNLTSLGISELNSDYFGNARSNSQPWSIGAANGPSQQQFKYQNYSFGIFDTTATPKCTTFAKCYLVLDTATASTFVRCDSVALGKNVSHTFTAINGKKNIIRSTSRK